MYFQRLYDTRLAQAAYLIGCQKTGEAVVIDPERDIDRYIRAAAENGLRITAVTETHIHADFLSGARELAEKTGARLYLSAEGGEEWSYRWLDAKSDGGSYDHELLSDGESFNVGKIEIRAVHTPGHTPEHLSFLVYDHGGGADEPIGIATGDFVFVGDVGRPDLLETAAGQQGSAAPAAHELHESLRWFDRLDPWLQVWPGHGAGSACGKALGAIPMTTVGYEQRYNPALRLTREGAAPFVADILSGQTEPPLYFARMKRENREGPAILGELPSPSHTPVDQIDRALESGAALLDTREWSDYRGAHLKGSYFVPWDNSFPTIAGSYVRPEQQIYLVLETADDLDEMVRSLVRVGLDRVVGYATAGELRTYLEGNSTRGAEIRTTTTEGLAATMREKDITILDVRGASEYDEAHVRGALQLAHTRLPAGLPNLPDDPLYVHCKSGARSAIASAWLQANGKNVTYVGGAFSEFESAGLPIESSRAEPVAG